MTLLPAQQDIYDTLKVHSSQGGFCLVMGMPGTGKTVIKEFLKNNESKQTLVVTIARTLHTYTNTIKILCQAFNVDFAACHFKCEKKLIEEAHSLKQQGKNIVIIIDEAHLMEITTLRKLRLLFEDFPKNHNVILIGQPELLNNINLGVNQDIKSRVTYSTITKRLNPDDMKAFILGELDRIKLGHNTFTEDAIDLIVRSSDGVLRKTRNLCLSCMLESVRLRTKIIGLDTVNRVLIQPHWRKEQDLGQIY
ncbi:MAG: AAA family ATPase [Candidatus Omnitrophica bacterium]|nr:AAA family ATPase [Candidatus Omnitrophota bacterium]